MSNELCDCAFGITGFQGVSGTPGINGSRGSQGSQGFQGQIGQFGSAGSQGVVGTEGIDGKMGPMGYPGRDGSMGYSGQVGSVGPPGPPGAPGVPGADGSPGPIGPRGYEGSVGQRGPAGSPGIRGDRGFQGIVGSQGSEGAQGESAGFNLVMESARTRGGVASSIATVGDGDTVRLWSAGGIQIGLQSGSAIYNLEPNNIISAVSQPTLSPSDPFRPAFYFDTSAKALWFWDPNNAGGTWVQQTGSGANGHYGSGQHIKVSNTIPQGLSSAIFVDLSGSLTNVVLSQRSLVKVSVFMVVSNSGSEYSLTGNFFLDEVVFDSDPSMIFMLTIESSNTQTVAHQNSIILSSGTYELKYMVRVGISQSVTIDQHYMKICVIGL